MDTRKEIQELFCSKHLSTLSLLLDCLQNLFAEKDNKSTSITTKPFDLDVIDKKYFDEIKDIATNSNMTIYFGKTLRELKCIFYDDEGLREYEIYLKYKSTRKYLITSVNLPFAPYQDKEYNSIIEIIETFRTHANSLSNYFRELERIDRFCSIMEPLKPTYKDDYRKILLDNRTWLHIEVTPDGTATNIHLIGKSEFWHEKLQTGLLSWDHDKEIVDNIMLIFDISNVSSALHREIPSQSELLSVAEEQICGICLCHALPDNPGVAQPLCQNTACGVYFHRSCLYEWLVACTGGRPPVFGVAAGSCPTCLHPIACSEKEDGTCR